MFSSEKVISAVLICVLGCFTSLEAYKQIETKFFTPVESANGLNFAEEDYGENSVQFKEFSSLGAPQFEPDPPATSDVPKKEMEYMFRVYATNCSCPQTKKQVDVADKSSKKRQHLPFGVPYSQEDNVTLRLLHNEDYVTAFDLKYRIPMWTSFTIDGKKSVSVSKDVCWTGDARIAFSDTAQCGDYDTSIVKRNDLLQRPVFPPDFSDPSTENQVAYITNSIPKSLNHTKFLENDAYQILKTWSKEEGHLNVIMGPAFDLNGNGTRPDIGTIMRTHAIHGPLIVPTHIFVVATWCSTKDGTVDDCDPSNLMAHGLLLPNKPFPIEYSTDVNILQKSTTRIADIEKLTGLTFYTALAINNADRLRTMSSSRLIPKTK